MNWGILIFVGLGAILLIIFLVKTNRKDKNDLVRKLNNDYHKTNNEENDAGNEPLT